MSNKQPEVLNPAVVEESVINQIAEKYNFDKDEVRESLDRINQKAKELQRSHNDLVTEVGAGLVKIKGLGPEEVVIDESVMNDRVLLQDLVKSAIHQHRENITMLSRENALKMQNYAMQLAADMEKK